MAKRRWQRPPRIRWFLAAWGLFVLACAVPAINHTLFFGDANATPSSEPGVSGLIWGYVFALGVLANPLGGGSETLYLASMALPNTFMLLSPILAFRLPPRASVFLFAAWT
ncbi:MAG: hypothetical protein K8T20_12440, partial [Planctomycetes bacterium]|nr:hypothetical protein [Planctomycetota bacterium]